MEKVKELDKLSKQLKNYSDDYHTVGVEYVNGFQGRVKRYGFYIGFGSRYFDTLDELRAAIDGHTRKDKEILFRKFSKSITSIQF
uniref:Uncharacterized protein n=1 Tax=viral metagenome TaxID=1070528 RepID=A0A6M3Y065_9ZZZZ